MSNVDQLKTRIEAAAGILGVAPSTVGERAGQGGQFYKRLCEGKRVWPETAKSVLARLDEMVSEHNARPESECEISHGGAKVSVQGGVGK
ncbi:hypothetical protein PVV74_17215 [Roseovarius sp. SK2]|uniref:hypothetical protein n=1 Tax=Roseovarius confluentis TaxID=1852027 RepID=UPI003C7C9C91|nr:hypothetical protein [Roseovarius sp. SK2]